MAVGPAAVHAVIIPFAVRLPVLALTDSGPIPRWSAVTDFRRGPC